MNEAHPTRLSGAAPSVPGASERPIRARVLYVINGFQRGGAEYGLVRLVRDGAFAGCDLQVVSIVGGHPALMDELRSLGVEVTPVSAGARMSLGGLARAGAFLVRRARLFRPHVTVLSLPQANILGRLVSFIAPLGVVCSFEHNTHLAKPVYEVAYRLLSGRVDVLLADAEATAREAAERLYIKNPAVSRVLPLVSFDPGPARVLAGAGPLRLVNAARFTAVKNQSAIIRAVDVLRARGVDVTLTLLGEGPELGACQALIAKLDLADRIKTPGHGAGWATSGDYDVFVLASRHEGLCIALLEAMHAGLAGIAPLIGGVRDYGSAGEVALIPDVEPQSLAEAIERFDRDRSAMIEIAKLGARAVRERFGAETVRARYASFADFLRQAAAAQSDT